MGTELQTKFDALLERAHQIQASPITLQQVQPNFQVSRQERLDHQKVKQWVYEAADTMVQTFPPGSANAFPFSIVHNANVPETLIPVLSPPAPAGTGPSRPARGSAGDWSTAGYRHHRINSGDPHISQRSFDSIPGGSRSLPSFSLS